MIKILNFGRRPDTLPIRWLVRKFNYVKIRYFHRRFLVTTFVLQNNAIDDGVDYAQLFFSDSKHGGQQTQI